VTHAAHGEAFALPLTRRYFERVSEPELVVRIADLEQGPKEITWRLSLPWLALALDGTDASPHEEGLARVELTKSGEDVVVRGRAHVVVTMPCSRTLEPMQVELDPEIFLLLSRAGEPTSSGRRGAARQPPAQKPRNPGQSRRSNTWVDDPRLNDQDAARDVFHGESIVLDAFLREFILLELPMNPVRSDLHATQEQATAPRPAPTGSPDPRLAPLAALLDRMRDQHDDKDKE
jgi:uncharacterized metal-binding protein YceD (DUF177 family)